MTEEEETKLLKISENFHSNGAIKNEVFESLLRNQKGFPFDKKHTKKPFRLVRFIVKAFVFIIALIVLTAIYGFRSGS